MPRMMPKPCDRPGCGTLVSGGIRFCDEHRKADFKRRTQYKRESNPEQFAFYNSPEWRRVRLGHLRREPFCRVCKTKGKDTFAAMVDHVLPVNQGGAKFDSSNLQSLCNPCHNRKRQEESLTVRKVDRSDVVVVCGPPGAGKSTYVTENFARGDLIVDLDHIIQAITFLPLHEAPAHVLPYASEVKTTLVSKILRSRDQAAWIITGGAAKKERDDLRRQGAHIVVIETPIPQCLQRLRDRPQAQIEHMEEIIRNWWARYERSEEDERLS